MQTSRPKSLTTVAVLLILLAVGSLATPLLSMSSLFAGNRPPGNFQQGGNNQNNGGNFQRNNGNGTGNGNFQGGGNFQSGNGNFPQRSRTGAFSLFSLARTLGLNGQVLIYLNYAIAVIGIALCLLAAFWVWKKKRKGLNLAMVLAICFLLGSFGGVFAGLRFVNATSVIRYGIGLVNLGASLVILFLTFLPSVRDEAD